MRAHHEVRQTACIEDALANAIKRAEGRGDSETVAMLRGFVLDIETARAEATRMIEAANNKAAAWLRSEVLP
jgi:hypothetical protein